MWPQALAGVGAGKLFGEADVMETRVGWQCPQGDDIQDRPPHHQ